MQELIIIPKSHAPMYLGRISPLSLSKYAYAHSANVVAAVLLIATVQQEAHKPG